MFKLFFELLTEPLGLPIELYYQYIILAIIGVISYGIAYSKVGDMYQGGFIDGRTLGSFFHWLIRLIIFAVLWAITYGVIWLGKIIIANWQVVLIGLVIVVALTFSIIFVVKKYRKSKAVSKNA
jgi:hypothetical protein